MPLVQPAPPAKISALAQEMMQRELAANPKQFDPKPGLDLGIGPGPQDTAMNPETVATLGAAADIAGTYEGLKHGYGEDNALYAGTPHVPEAYRPPSPAHVAGDMLMQLAVQKLGTGLLRKLGAKSLADAIAANTGAYQAGLGANWGRLLTGEQGVQSGYDAVNGAFQRNDMRHGNQR